MSVQTDHYTAITREFILPGLVDNFFYNHPLLDMLWKKRDTITHGRLIDWRFSMSGNQSLQTYSAFAQFLARPVEFAKQASLPWCHMVMPVELSIIENAMNGKGTAEGDLKLVRESLKNAKLGFNDRLSQDIHGDGSAFAHPYWAAKVENPIVGLQKILSTGRTYARWNSSTYAVLDPYVIEIAAGTDYGDIQTEGNQYYLPHLIEEGMNETDYGDGKIDILVGSIIMAQAYKQAIQGKETRVIIDGGVGNTAKFGVNSAEYRNTEVISDRDMPGGALYGLNSEKIGLKVLAGFDMTFNDFEETNMRDTIVANFKLSAQLVATEPRSLFAITGGPTNRNIAG